MSLEYNRDLIGCAKELRKNATLWENKLWYKFLRSYPVRFQRQKTIDNYIADFYCARAKLVIELDGGEHYCQEQMQRDQTRTEKLQEFGLEVMRISNRELDRNFYGVCGAIDKVVKQRL